MYSITWLDPRTDPADEPAWAVWETECGTYHIVWGAATDTYEPYTVVCNQLNRDSMHTQQRRVAPDQPTLEAAQDAVNRYHCRQHNLILA